MTAEALQHPLFQITNNGAAGEAWAKIPAFAHYGRVNAAKPGAQIWALHQTDEGPKGRRILMASQRYGNGLSAILTVQNFWVWRLSKDGEPEQFDRLEFSPGEEMQVDYGEGAPTRVPGTTRYRKPRLFVATLRYSRRSFRRVVWKSSQENWARLHEQAWRYFGGSCRYVVLDNLKEGVLKPDIHEPELNPVFAAMLKHYDVLLPVFHVGRFRSQVEVVQYQFVEPLIFEYDRNLIDRFRVSGLDNSFFVNIAE